MKLKPLDLIDFYKVDHRRQYPAGTNKIYANLTARSAKHSPWLKDNKTVFYGLQYFIKDYLIDLFNDEFFNLSVGELNDLLSEHKNMLDSSLGGDNGVFMFTMLHRLGHLPIEIKALPEGSRVDIGVPYLTITNTHDDFFWLVNYIETLLSCVIWRPITSATIAHHYRQLCLDASERTCDDTSHVNFQCHDFSFRGLSNPYDAALSGSAHLLSFMGSDTVPAIQLAKEYYDAEGVVAMSVPATEHSVMCMGSKESELETFSRLITKLYPSGIVSVVSDTWDLWKVLTEYLPKLKEEVLAREGKLVIRPDSGDPADIICGETIEDFSKDCEDIGEFRAWCKDTLLERLVDETGHGEWGGDEVVGKFKFEGKCYECVVDVRWNRFDKQFYFIERSDSDIFMVEIALLPKSKGVVELLWDEFGGSINSKGYKVLDPHVGVIYGDSITMDRAVDIFQRLEEKGFASSNIVFGVGSFTYQYQTRDTFGIAMKTTYGEIGAVPQTVFKDPITDGGIKRSAKGLLQVVKSGDDYVLNEEVSLEDSGCGELRTVFKNGKVFNKVNYNDIRFL